MRPRGDARVALAHAARMLAAEHGPMSARALAERARIDFERARWAVKDMARAGELIAVGREKPAGEKVRWHWLYEPGPAEGRHRAVGFDALESAMRRMVATAE